MRTNGKENTRENSKHWGRGREGEREREREGLHCERSAHLYQGM